MSAKSEAEKLKAELAAKAVAPNAAGSDQVKKALAQKPSDSEVSSKSLSNKETTPPKPLTAKKSPKKKAKPKKADSSPNGVLQKTSIALYPEDQELIFAIEDELPRGRYSVSEIIRIALRAVDPSKADLVNILNEVRALDTRRIG